MAKKGTVQSVESTPSTPVEGQQPAGNGRVFGKKTECPLTREGFRMFGRRLKVVVTDQQGVEHNLDVDVKEFSTGSFGWYSNGKVSIEINGEKCAVQYGLNFTIVGSKDAPQ